MPAVPEDRCPRCGGAFLCGMSESTPCACSGVALDARLQVRLRERYVGCLCMNCLRDMARGAALEAPGTAPQASA